MKQRRQRKWSDEQLKSVVKSCTNLSDVLRGLGLRVAGGNHKSVQYWIEQLGIDTSHFSSEKQIGALHKYRRKLDESEVLCYASKASKNTVRRLAQKRIKYECKECANPGEHRGKLLVLQLDHINGDSSDNRLENLRWLCPNCHSQTETFAGKKAFDGNVSYKRKCKCGTPIASTSKQCRSCWNNRF